MWECDIDWESDCPIFRFSYVSKPAERLLGYPAPDWLATPDTWIGHIHPDDREHTLSYCLESTLAQRDHELEYRMIAADGRIVWLRDIVTVVVERCRPVKLQGIMVDITAQKRLQQRQAALHGITQALAGSGTVEECATLGLQAICEALGLDVGEFWIVNDLATQVRCGANWSAPSVDAAEFFAMAQRTAFTPGDGIPCRVWASGRPVWISNLSTDSQIVRAEAAARAGLRSAFAVPVQSGGRPLGVMTFFCRDHRPPDEELIALMSDVGGYAGQFLERRRTEEALRQSEERLRLAADGAGLVIWDWDIHRDRMTWRGGPASQGMGLAPAPDPGGFERYLQRLHPDDRRAVSAEVESALRSGTNYEVTFRFIRPDGAVRWGLSTGQALRDPEGRVLRMIGVDRDITDLLQAEEALRATTRKLGSMLTSVTDCVWSAEVDAACNWRYRYYSPVIEKITARPPEFYVSGPESWLKIVHLEDRDQMLLAYRRLHRGLSAWEEQEYRIFLPDGSIRWVRDSAKRTCLPDGSIRIDGVLSDISSRKDAEGALREGEERFRSILDNSTCVVQLLDANGRFLFVNRQWETLFGCSREQVAGKDPHDVVDPSVAAILREGVGEIFQTHCRIRKEEMIPHADGFRSYISSRFALVDSAGAPYAACCILTDITDRKRVEEALGASESEFRATFELAAVGQVQCDPQTGRIVRVNRRIREILGYTERELLSTTLFELADPPIREENLASFRLLVEGETRNFTMEKRLRRKDGTSIWAHVTASLIRDREARPLRVAVICQDITERKRAEDALRESEERFRGLTQVAPDAMLLFRHGGVAYANQAALKLFGAQSAGDLIGLAPAELVHPDCGALFMDQVERVELGTRPSPAIEHRIQKMDGSESEVEASATSFVDRGEVVVLAVLRDISQRKLIERQLLRYAYHDPLTQLPNSTLFLERLARRVRIGRRDGGNVFAVLFLDLDRFKLVNDSLGHSIGDQLLVQVAGRLRDAVGSEDTVARLGGDEFVILLDEVENAGHAGAIAERILSVFRLPHCLGGQDVFVSASLGVAISSMGYEESEEILRDADAAMYRAKAMGRARYVVFDKRMQSASPSSWELEHDLRLALDRNEFVLHYQPLFSLRSGAVKGFEALLRWRHPKRGLLYPREFLGLAEEGGIIWTLDRWVIEEACRQRQQWAAINPAVQMAVNVSGHSLKQPDFYRRIRSSLERSGLSPELLGIEITEQVLVDASECLPLFERLRRIGVELLLDDFGTGYSSLTYLSLFPISQLKIDSSFVRRLDSGGRRDSAVVRTVVALAEGLNLQVTAEGVETETQMNLVRAMGCHYAQGNYCGAPMDAATAFKVAGA